MHITIYICKNTCVKLAPCHGSTSKWFCNNHGKKQFICSIWVLTAPQIHLLRKKSQAVQIVI